jgi:hypothetical protein
MNAAPATTTAVPAAQERVTSLSAIADPAHPVRAASVTEADRADKAVKADAQAVTATVQQADIHPAATAGIAHKADRAVKADVPAATTVLHPAHRVLKMIIKEVIKLCYFPRELSTEDNSAEDSQERLAEAIL